MIFRAKAPLRLGLAGGGSDVSPYSELFGGAILNATINLYAYATIEPLKTGAIILQSIDQNKLQEHKPTARLQIDDTLSLLKGVYNRIVRDFTKKPLSFKLTTYVDAPPGSGLGSSSTLVVAVLGAFVEWLNLPLGEYDIARLAYEIERLDLGYAGGKQDQYAATFGGFNFMEFSNNDKVIVNPLRIKKSHIMELEFNFVLYYSAISRLSSKIIDQQVKNVKLDATSAIEAMHKVKEQAYSFKEALLTGKMADIGSILDYSWQQKKKMASKITNPVLDKAYSVAMHSGATGGKVSGAGGGGFMMFYCPGNSRYNVIENLEALGGEFRRFLFTQDGLTTWSQ